MKKVALIFIAAASFLFAQLYAQAPQRFQYQAVARDINGLLTNATIGIQILIYQNGPSGTLVYQEEHAPVQTNEFGQFTLQIGGGTTLMGNFSIINWETGPYWMEVLFRPNPGAGYLSMGATQFLSVPYALFASNATNTTSQWSNNPNGIHYGAGAGNVGIGTNEPLNKLTLRGVDSNADEDLFQIRKDNATGVSRNFYVRMRPGIPEAMVTTDGPRLTLGPVFGQSAFLTMLTNENSGFNTNNPEAGVDIIRANGAPALRVTKSAGTEPVAIFRRDPDPGFQPAMVITRQGQVGINTDNPTQALHVAGNICYTGNIATCSDGRYKHDFQPVVNALDKLTRIRGGYYYWNQKDFPDKNFSEKRQIGVIAQEVERQFPEIVFTDKDGYKSVDYVRLTPVLIEALKEQQAQIRQLKAEVNKTDQLEARLAQIEMLLKKESPMQAAKSD